MNYVDRKEFKLDRRVHSLAFGAHNIVFGFEIGIECRTFEGTERWGKHQDTATVMVFAPAESYVIYADDRGVLNMRTIEKGISSVLNKKCEGNPLQALFLNPKGDKLMAGDASGHLLGWPAPFDGQPHIEQFDSSAMVSIVSAPKREGYGCASKRKIGYHLGGPRMLTFPVRHDITTLGLCTDPEKVVGILIIVAQGNLLEVYDMRGNQVHTFACDSPVTSLAVHPQGEFFATGEENGRVQLWHPVKGRTCELHNIGSRVDHLAFNSGRQLCAVSSRGVVAIFGKE